MKVQKQKQPNAPPDFHCFTTLEEHARLHPVAHALLAEQYGVALLKTATLRNPLKTSQTVVLHIGQPRVTSPHLTRFKNEDTNIHLVLEPGETREVPVPIADAAHVVDEDLNLVVGGRAPALRILEKRDGEFVDVTPELHPALAISIPDDKPTRARARR